MSTNPFKVSQPKGEKVAWSGTLEANTGNTRENTNDYITARVGQFHELYVDSVDVDDLYVNVSGDTMTGDLKMSADNAVSFGENPAFPSFPDYSIYDDSNILYVGISTNVGPEVWVGGIIDGENDTFFKVISEESSTGHFKWMITGVNQLNLDDGVLYPETNNDIDLGTSSKKFKDGYFANNVVLSTINGNTPKGYTLQQVQITRGTPVDNTTYYFGSVNAFTTTANISRVYIPASGTITRVDVVFHNSGVLGTSEASSGALRLNNTSNTNFTTSITNDATFTHATGNPNLSVSAGDYIEFVWLGTNWSTNPTNVIPQFTAYIQ